MWINEEEQEKVDIIRNIRSKMTSKSSNQLSSRRYPLKRVRPNNENQGSISSTNGRIFKKLCRQPSQGFNQSFSILIIIIDLSSFYFPRCSICGNRKIVR